MDRNYLSVRLTIWHLEAAIDEIRPITIENGELSICTERALLCQAIYLQKIKINMDFLYKSTYKRSFRHRIHSLLRRADARGSADITDCI